MRKWAESPTRSLDQILFPDSKSEALLDVSWHDHKLSQEDSQASWKCQWL